MKYVAIIVLAVLGLAELVFRAVFAFLCAVSVLGVLMLLALHEMGSDSVGDLLKPWCFSAIDKLLEADKVKVRELERLRADKARLEGDVSELRGLLVAADAEGR